MKNKKEKPKSLLEKYNDLESKGNLENTLLKGTIDAVAGSVIGTSIGALTGDKAVLAGLGLIFLGNYLGDESGLMRVTGASTLALGIAKANEYQNNPELDTPSKRLSGLKNDWLKAFHLKWKNESEEKTINPEKNQTNDEEDSTSSVA